VDAGRGKETKEPDEPENGKNLRLISIPDWKGIEATVVGIPTGNINWIIWIGR